MRTGTVDRRKASASAATAASSNAPNLDETTSVSRGASRHVLVLDELMIGRAAAEARRQHLLELSFS